MNSSDELPTRVQPRREFLGQIAVSAIVLAGPGRAIAHGQVDNVLTGAGAHSAGGAQPIPGSREWDDSWAGRLVAKHKAVFDSPQIEDGNALDNAVGYIGGMRDALSAGASDVQTVIVIRHDAIAMVLNDAMWAKYELGKDKKIKDSESGEWAKRNPYIGTVGGGQPTQVSDRPAPTFSWLSAHGHILLACDLATQYYAGVLARHVGGDKQAVYEELKANLVPGVILQPTGVYAALRAQEAGCAYIRST